MKELGLRARSQLIVCLSRTCLCRATPRTRRQTSAPASRQCPASTEQVGLGAEQITTAPPPARLPPTARTASWVRHRHAHTVRSWAVAVERWPSREKSLTAGSKMLVLRQEVVVVVVVALNASRCE